MPEVRHKDQKPHRTGGCPGKKDTGVSVDQEESSGNEAGGNVYKEYSAEDGSGDRGGSCDFDSGG